VTILYCETRERARVYLQTRDDGGEASRVAKYHAAKQQADMPQGLMHDPEQSPHCHTAYSGASGNYNAPCAEAMWIGRIPSMRFDLKLFARLDGVPYTEMVLTERGERRLSYRAEVIYTLCQ